MSAELWCCDGCMRYVERRQIADIADGEHVLCRSCWSKDGAA